MAQAIGVLAIRSFSDHYIRCIVMLSFFCCDCVNHSYVKFFGGALFVGINAARALCVYAAHASCVCMLHMRHTCACCDCVMHACQSWAVKIPVVLCCVCNMSTSTEYMSSPHVVVAYGRAPMSKTSPCLSCVHKVPRSGKGIIGCLL